MLLLCNLGGFFFTEMVHCSVSVGVCVYNRCYRPATVASNVGQVVSGIYNIYIYLFV